MFVDLQDDGEGNCEGGCHDKETEAWGDVSSGRVEAIVDHGGEERARGLHHPNSGEEHSYQQRDKKNGSSNSSLLLTEAVDTTLSVQLIRHSK